MAARKFDIVVYGATGYVGRFLCQRLAPLSSIKWAAAGRSAERVAKMMKGMGIENVEALQADASDLDAMNTLAKQTKVVINATGPAITMGENVVRACIQSKTNYCDITGEAEWVDGMKRRYHKEAVDAGVHVVSCTGFDSIPSDILVFMSNQELEKAGHGKLGQADLVFKMKDNGGVPHGTMETVITMRERFMKGLSRFVPMGGQGTAETGEPLVSKEAMKSLRVSQAAFWPIAWVDATKMYMPVHFMKSIDERVVFASASELNYHKGLLLNETMHVPSHMSWLRGTLFSSLVVCTLGAAFASARFEWVKTQLRKLVKEPTQKGHVHVTLTGTTVDKDAFVKAVMCTPKLGAGLGLTSLTCLESALCLVEKDTRPLPGLPGFRTPAVAFGDRLLSRLQEHAEIQVAVAASKTRADLPKSFF